MLVPLDDYPRNAGFAAELVNTAPEVMVSTGDGLRTAEALTDLLDRHGFRPDAGPPSDDDAAAVRALRRPLRAIIEAPDADRAAARAGELSLRCGGGLQLGRLAADDGGPWRWQVRSRPGAALADELGLVAAVGLLSVIETLGHHRFRSCAAPTCVGVVVDTSRAGRRRYCEPLICGNRVNVANYRARRRGRS